MASLSIKFGTLLFAFLGMMFKLFKWCIGITTGCCELQRIIQSNIPRSAKCCRIEKSLLHSSLHEGPKLLSVKSDSDADAESDSKSDESGSVDSDTSERLQQLAHRFVSLKRVTPEIWRESLLRSLLASVNCARNYRRLKLRAELECKTKFIPDYVPHERLLLSLWRGLHPDSPELPARIGRHWTDIGFQGTDPQTDFRGMGMLGLLQLEFLANKHQKLARRMLQQSQHPKLGFPFAIVGINLTGVVVKLLNANSLRRHFCNATPQCRMHHLHQIYCYVFYNFAELWQQRQATVMQFNCIRDELYSSLSRQAFNDDCRFLLPSDDQLWCEATRPI